jgi:hypothetical protein
MARYIIGLSLALLVAIPTGQFVRQSLENAAAALREANMK